MELVRGPEDLRFHRIHAGVGFDVGGQNTLLLVLDRRVWED